MKIYLEPVDDDIIDLEQIATNILNIFPSQFLPAIKKILDTNVNLQKKYANTFSELSKLKIMWALRFLEKEIDNEGGLIIITKSGKIETKDFSSELSEKIKNEESLN